MTSDGNHTPRIKITNTQRIFPKSQPPVAEQVIPLSLLDATTSNFGLTSAIWLFSPNSNTTVIPSSSRFTNQQKPLAHFSHLHHLLQSLKECLNSYPQWCGHIKAINSLDENGQIVLPPETRSFPAHARRFGRLYVRFNTPQDPGVEFITATSSATWQDLYPEHRVEKHPNKPHVWTDSSGENEEAPGCHSLKAFSPSTHIATMLAPHNFTGAETNPVLAIQITQLSPVVGTVSGTAEGGFVLAAKAAHPLADITGLAQFINHWATLSRCTLDQHPLEATVSMQLEGPIFDPSLLDDQAAGDINAPNQDVSILKTANCILPFHKFDWWFPGPDYPSHILPSHIPPALQHASQIKHLLLKPQGNSMPWSTWDLSAPLSTSTIHFTAGQVDTLHWASSSQLVDSETSETPRAASRPQSPKPTKHDALVAHIWSRIVAARNFTTVQDLNSPVCCNLTLGLRRVLNLPATFQGSPIVMVPVWSTPKRLVNNDTPLPDIPCLIRSTLTSIANAKSSSPSPESKSSNYTDAASPEYDTNILQIYLHTLSYASSPQRIWQAFLGRTHTIVTSWARSGIYKPDFGLGHGTPLYVDGDLPLADGFVLIKEAGGGGVQAPSKNNRSPYEYEGGLRPGSSWTEKGVDVTVTLNSEDMRRLLTDPLLFP